MGDQSTTALSGIDLSIARGEFVSLIGPSGCGKSTLLRIIGDLIDPTDGEVEIDGKPPRAQRGEPATTGWSSRRRSCSTGERSRTTSAAPRDHGLGRARRTAKAREMLELVELGDFLGHYPYQLSGGMQQRVAIARALAFEPSILLMDEPFGALDEMTRERMNSEVLRIWQQTGTTVVFVTHSIPEAVFLSSRVVVMSARPGRITRIVDVDLPRPRDDETRERRPRYFELVTDVREALRRAATTGWGLGSDRRTRARGRASGERVDRGRCDPGIGRVHGICRGRCAASRRHLPAVAVFFGGIALLGGHRRGARRCGRSSCRGRRRSSPR